MARYNEILVGRYNRFVQKLFSMKGPASLSTLSDELMPVWPFTNGVENRYLEGWDTYGSSNGIAGVAANNSAIKLRNPAGSNTVIIFSKIQFSNNVNMNVRFGISSAVPDFGTIITLTNLRFDARNRPTPSLIATSQNNAPFTVPVVNWNAVTGGATAQGQSIDAILTDDQEIPLLPGDTLSATEATVNQSLNMTFWWRERFLEDSERA